MQGEGAYLNIDGAEQHNSPIEENVQGEQHHHHAANNGEKATHAVGSNRLVEVAESRKRRRRRSEITAEGRRT